MKALPVEVRREVERTVINARRIAETAAQAALTALAVYDAAAYPHMDQAQRSLRRRLRTHARQLGDLTNSASANRLVNECAFEQWHRMLFARFLAENDLLIEPESTVAVTLDECEELAGETGKDKWALAAKFAEHMLPQVFRADLPVTELRLAHEHRLKLEKLVEALPASVFDASDALGWVYQFWQTERKAEINASATKAGADEIPAVTQLFTEPYMVQFLLHNGIGAWWAERLPGRPCPVELTYLRRTPVAEPGADQADGLGEFRLLDPCCGSGHFLVGAFLMLVPMRMALEGLDANEAVDAVLRQNLHGLELDRRCVAIAAFSIALEAWRYPGAGGYRPLPQLRIAWCGQPVGDRQRWLALANGDVRRTNGMAALYDVFKQAPVLGSLIEPESATADVFASGHDDLRDMLQQALRAESPDDALGETAIAALGLTAAAELLACRYHMVVTNVPYLGREKQVGSLRHFCEHNYPLSKHDLATVFVERLIKLCEPDGRLLLVLPWNWLFLARYKALRKQLLKQRQWRLLATLGAGAFETIAGEVVRTCLLSMQPTPASGADTFPWLDVSEVETPAAKAQTLQDAQDTPLSHAGQLANPDSIIGYAPDQASGRVEDVAYSYQGLATSDNAQFVFNFWELPAVERGWEFFQFAPDDTAEVSGCSHVILWGGEGDRYARHAAALKKEGRLGGWKSGHAAWGKRGIAINRMGDLPASLYFGTKFDCNVAVLVPNEEADIPALWAYCSSPAYRTDVRKLNKKLSVTNGTLAKVPFEASAWRTMDGQANALEVRTADLTQWAFHGNPRDATSPLHVATARLLGYQWPVASHPDLPLTKDARALLEDGASLNAFADKDGIVCLPSVVGEPPAHERLLSLLSACWGDDWNDAVLARLLADADATDLDGWLRDRFFEQHCRLFRNRPFIWHVWDGRYDGFHALVNYHKLVAVDGRGRQLLESLAYSYLGDWISRQREATRRNVGGAEDRLAAAVALQDHLAAIIEGAPPFDIFVRWKPMHDQPLGWAPDVDDGVRLNIRPFMAVDIPGGRKGAGVLRVKPNVHWRPDRGKEAKRDAATFPWFWEDGRFMAARVNDHHLTLAEKQRARTSAASTEAPA